MYWFLAKILYNFVSLPLKFNNPYLHIGGPFLFWSVIWETKCFEIITFNIATAKNRQKHVVYYVLARVQRISYWNELCVTFLKQIEEHKCPKLFKAPINIIRKKYWSFYPSKPFIFVHFTLIHPVEVVTYIQNVQYTIHFLSWKVS